MGPLEPFALKGKQILVTGASSGIGQGIAIACSQMGAEVTITGRNEMRLNETLCRMVNGGHRAIVADLTDDADRKRLADLSPKLDGLVQCAGTGNRIICRSITREDISSVMDVNFTAPVLLQALLLSNKKINKSASIIYIASRAYESPSIGNAVYSASKGAIISYAKCLALELSPRLIRVNCICPGMVWTDMASITNASSEQDLSLSEQKYPLKRFGTVEDVANLSVYLLSDASSWMTGNAIDISGGGEGVLG